MSAQAEPAATSNVAAVSILFPVYNGEKYVREAIESALNEQKVALECVVLDDGSTDNSAWVIADIGDARVRYFHHPNRGLAATLNRGIGLARGRYIARLDQDDLILPGRLARQVEFLDQHSDCALVGTWSRILEGDKPTSRGHQHPALNDTLRLELLFDNPFVHSSIMMRVEVVRSLGGYCEDRSRQPPEDYELWSRIAHAYAVANIAEVLTVYREVDTSMSRAGPNPFLANVVKIAGENLAEQLAPAFSRDTCRILAAVYHGQVSVPAKSGMPRGKALRMHELAALRIAGDKASWTAEFLDAFERQRAYLKSRFLWRRLPQALIGPARRVKRYFSDRARSSRRGA